jgi:ABC-2 type transport system permease protein
MERMARLIRKIAGMAGIAVRDRMQYRFDFFMTLVPTLLMSILYYMVWLAFYRYSADQALPWDQLITYVMIGQAISFARFSPADRAPVYGMATRIRSGDVAVDLIRPVGFQLQRFAEALGFFVVELLWVNIPTVLLFIWGLKVSPPRDVAAAAGFLASLVMAFIVAFGLNSIAMMLSFWTINAQGIQKAKRAVMEILAGTLIPFEFFPAWLKGVALHLPFQSMAYIPLSIYTGKIAGPAIYGALAEQLGWAMVMLAASRLLWGMASRRITVYGG